MTHFAGMYSRDAHQPLRTEDCDTLKRSVRRGSNGELAEFSDGRFYLVKFDIGAHTDRAMISDARGDASCLAGEPLIVAEGVVECAPRSQDLARLHGAEDLAGLLQSANGVFCGVRYRAGDGTVELYTDKIGNRSLYVYADERLLVFATALRILEACPFVRRRLDVAAITQQIGLGWFLGDRTAYADIRLLKAAEIVKCKGHSFERSTYYHWDEIPPTTLSPDEQHRELYRRFEVAVRRRLRSDRTTVSLLSGGLDSRCLVSMLRTLGANVHTRTFFEEDTPDQVYAAKFAHAIGTFHEPLVSFQNEGAPFNVLLDRAWRESKARLTWPPERKGFVWCGDGGSLMLGMVLTTSRLLELFRTQSVDSAVDEFCGPGRGFTSRRLFTREAFEKLGDCVRDGLKAELRGINSRDPGRKYPIYLMVNSQRRLMNAHLEELDLYPFDLQEPFLDSEFVQLTMALPLDELIYHRFYNKWLDQFPPVVSAIPWQAYPEHEPSANSENAQLANQWSKKHSPRRQAAYRRSLIERSRALLRSPDFPGEILNRKTLRTALQLYSLGLNKYRRLLTAALKFHGYAKHVNAGCSYE